MKNFRIKKEKKEYTLLRVGHPVMCVSADELVSLSNVVIEYVVGHDFIVLSSKKEAVARGFGRYHYGKGFLLAWWRDLKKIFQKNGN